MNCDLSLYNVPTNRQNTDYQSSNRLAKSMDLRTGKIIFQFIGSFIYNVIAEKAKLNMYLFSVRYLNGT